MHPEMPASDDKFFGPSSLAYSAPITTAADQNHGVIPAKAGISPQQAWIPAFAGMTQWVVINQMKMEGGSRASKPELRRHATQALIS